MIICNESLNPAISPPLILVDIILRWTSRTFQEQADPGKVGEVALASEVFSSAFVIN